MKCESVIPLASGTHEKVGRSAAALQGELAEAQHIAIDAELKEFVAPIGHDFSSSTRALAESGVTCKVLVLVTQRSSRNFLLD